MGLPVILLAALSVLLATSSTATPANRDDQLEITQDLFMDEFIKYTSQHDIVSLLLPLNKINFGDDEDNETDEEESDDSTIFFTEADVDNNGDRQYKGLSVYHKGKATKVLENGRDATAFNDDSVKVYIGATDGIYIYENGTTKKYGALSDSIIQIEADNQTGTVYILTDDHQLFSIDDEGNTKNKVEAITDVKEFVIDYISNIYYFDSNNQLHVFNQEGVKKFEDLPKVSTLKLIRPMFVQEEGAIVVVGKTPYVLNPNGTSTVTGISLEVTPTAYALDATILHYYAINKKIYEINFLTYFLSELADEDVKAFLDNKKDDIKNIATKSRSAFGV